MASAQDIIARALTRLSILRIGNTPSAAQSAHALQSLNSMIDSWAASGVVINQNIPLPAEHEPAFTDLLAIRLAPDYGVQPSPFLVAEAKNGWNALQAAYVFAPQANFDSAIKNLPSQRLLGQRGVPFNIASVTPSAAPSVTGFCTLTAGAPTTAVTDANCLTSSSVTLTPYSASAQNEWNSVRPTVVPGAGSFTVTHENNQVGDRTFEYLIVI
jgi:hypothetical protein